MADPDCPFCKIVAGEIPATKVHEADRTVAGMAISPAPRGPRRVSPRAHAADVHALAEEDLCAVARTAKRMSGRLVERLGADGVNVIQNSGPAAWQTVFHYHVHVVPRYADDPLRLPWVPRQGDLDEIRAAGQELL